LIVSLNKSLHFPKLATAIFPIAHVLQSLAAPHQKAGSVPSRVESTLRIPSGIERVERDSLELQSQCHNDWNGFHLSVEKLVLEQAGMPDYAEGSRISRCPAKIQADSQISSKPSPGCRLMSRVNVILSC
jgi:hypothetical protein